MQTLAEIHVCPLADNMKNLVLRGNLFLYRRKGIHEKERKQKEWQRVQMNFYIGDNGKKPKEKMSRVVDGVTDSVRDSPAGNL